MPYVLAMFDNGVDGHCINRIRFVPSLENGIRVADILNRQKPNVGRYFAVDDDEAARLVPGLEDYDAPPNVQAD
jgi:hypothetical protein